MSAAALAGPSCCCCGSSAGEGWLALSQRWMDCVPSAWCCLLACTCFCWDAADLSAERVFHALVPAPPVSPSKGATAALLSTAFSFWLPPTLALSSATCRLTAGGAVSCLPCCMSSGAGQAAAAGGGRRTDLGAGLLWTVGGEAARVPFRRRRRSRAPTENERLGELNSSSCTPLIQGMASAETASSSGPLGPASSRSTRRERVKQTHRVSVRGWEKAVGVFWGCLELCVHL